MVDFVTKDKMGKNFYVDQNLGDVNFFICQQDLPRQAFDHIHILNPIIMSPNRHTFRFRLKKKKTKPEQNF